MALYIAFMVFNGLVRFSPLVNGEKAGNGESVPNSNGRSKRQTPFVPMGGYCPQGYIHWINTANDMPQGCPRGQQECPWSYRCMIGSQRQYLCCGQRGQCPNGGSYQLDAYRQPVACSQTFRRCPYPSQCMTAVGGAYGQHICCNTGGGGTDSCPDGRRALITGGRVQRCSNTNRCNVDRYECVRSITSNANICCRVGSSQSPGDCPSGSRPESARSCRRNADCGAAYTCQPTNNGVRGCCRGGGPDLCPNGGRLENNRECFSDSDCGGSFSCVATDNGVRGCCSGGRPGLCPNNAVLDSNNPCTDDGDCNSGFECLLTSNDVRGCCQSRGPDRCPGGRRLESRSACSSDSDCGMGYSCTSADNGVLGCCEDEQSPETCPSGGTLDSQLVCDSNADCSGDAECVVTSNGIRGCCVGSTDPQDANRCSTDRLPDFDSSGNARRCTNTFNCRQAYECVENKAGSFSICCQGPRCPGGTTIGNGQNGIPIDCTRNGGSCPASFTCRDAVNDPDNRRICCPTRRRRRNRRRRRRY